MKLGVVFFFIICFLVVYRSEYGCGFFVCGFYMLCIVFGDFFFVVFCFFGYIMLFLVFWGD